VSIARLSELLTSLLRRRTPEGDPLPDSLLLDRFSQARDPAAFELLVWRHGPMVLAACKRVLRDAHAAEDAFQAVFLILAKKAGELRGSTAAWLHRVAWRVCVRMKRRLPPGSLATDPVAPTDADAVEAAEHSAILDEEVSRLPEFLRLPVVLCYLQGHTSERVAEILGIPRGTVLSRLASARRKLAVRLTARGVAPLVAAVAVPELPADTGREVGEAAIGFVLGQSTTGVPVQLAREVLTMTKRTMMTTVAAVLVLTAGVGTGIGFVAAQGQGGKQPPATAAAADPKKPPTPVIGPKDELAERRERVRMMLKIAELEFRELSKEVPDGGADPAALREQLRLLETRYFDLQRQVRTERLSVTPELASALDAAQQRLEATKTAAVPADVLAEAVKSHPKVVELQAKLREKEEAVRTSKLPKDDTERKKLDEERVALFKDLQATQKQVAPEVEAYLRAPGVVEAKKAVAAVEFKLRQVERASFNLQDEYEMVRKEVETLRAKLKVLEPVAEELAWLKEKRKRLKQELLELELKEVGIGK
jgi:RNA polymerase sigma factor (sigma-70 family)